MPWWGEGWRWWRVNGNENERGMMLLNQWVCLAEVCQGVTTVVEKRRGLCWVFFERPGARTNLKRLCQDGKQGRLRVQCHRYCQVSALATKPRSQGRHAVPCPGGRRGPGGGESSRMPRADWHGAAPWPKYRISGRRLRAYRSARPRKG